MPSPFDKHPDALPTGTQTEVRKAMKQREGKRIEKAEDNSFNDLNRGDWVRIPTVFGHDDGPLDEMGKIDSVWATNDGEYVVVERNDGDFAAMDPYTVTRLAPNPKDTVLFDKERVTYQKSEWASWDPTPRTGSSGSTC